MREPTAMNDDQKKRFREKLLQRLPPDCRTDAANKHVEAIHVVERIIGRVIKGSPFHDFLAGWDAAMELHLPELLAEHEHLHGVIMDHELDRLRKENQ